MLTQHATNDNQLPPSNMKRRASSEISLEAAYTGVGCDHIHGGKLCGTVPGGGPWGLSRHVMTCGNALPLSDRLACQRCRERDCDEIHSVGNRLIDAGSLRDNVFVGIIPGNAGRLPRTASLTSSSRSAPPAVQTGVVQNSVIVKDVDGNRVEVSIDDTTCVVNNVTSLLARLEHGRVLHNALMGTLFVDVSRNAATALTGLSRAQLWRRQSEADNAVDVANVSPPGRERARLPTTVDAGIQDVVDLVARRSLTKSIHGKGANKEVIDYSLYLPADSLRPGVVNVSEFFRRYKDYHIRQYYLRNRIEAGDYGYASTWETLRAEKLVSEIDYVRDFLDQRFWIKGERFHYFYCEHCREGKADEATLTALEAETHRGCGDKCTRNGSCDAETKLSADNDDDAMRVERLAELRERVRSYREHVRVRDHQFDRYKKQIEELGEDEMLIVFDFMPMTRDCYSKVSQSEMRAAHEVFVIVCLWREKGELHSYNYNYFGGYEEDDKTKVKNGFHFVRTALTDLFNRSEFKKFKVFKVWSDTGPSHFRIQRSLVFACIELLLMYRYIQELMWNFFQVMHGKGRADQAGATISRHVKSVVLSGRSVCGIDAAIDLLNEERESQFSMRLPEIDASSESAVNGLTKMRNESAHFQWRWKPGQTVRRGTNQFIMLSRPLSDTGAWVEQKVTMLCDK